MHRRRRLCRDDAHARARRQAAAGLRLLLISEESHTTFNPMLPEAVGASIFPEQVVAPIRANDRARALRDGPGDARSIPRAGRLTASTLAGDVTLPYEHLVLAFGNRARLDLIPGLESTRCRSRPSATRCTSATWCCAGSPRSSSRAIPGCGGSLGHFVIIGGGFSGVETAGELVDCLRSIRRYYPRVAADELAVTLLQDGPRLLPELSERLGLAAHRSLARRGVDVRVGARAIASATRRSLWTTATRVPTATVICTIGTRPNALVERMTAADRARPHRRESRPVGSRHARRVGGRRLRAGRATPTTANSRRRRRSSRCARRACRSEPPGRRSKGQPTRAFDYRARGSMAAIGHIARASPTCSAIPVTGLPAWLLWRAYYLSQMPTFGRKLRIFVEWTWGMFFPNDITHLRFNRSHELRDTP